MALCRVGMRKGDLDSGMKQRWRLTLFFNHNDSSDFFGFLFL